MSFQFKLDWLDSGNDAPEYKKTMAMLELSINGTKLTQHEDIWSQSIRDAVLVSAYPLAMWLASSWWRLFYEPLPGHNTKPTNNWRMNHELGAANHGFVWPQLVFASDYESMQVWALPSKASPNQSVRYLNGISDSTIPLAEFQAAIDSLVDSVVSRLDAVGISNADLMHLWAEVKAERADLESAKYRQVEAEMGFDPDEAPQELMDKALTLDSVMGASARTELAPLYGQSTESLDALNKMATDSDAVDGELQQEIRAVRVNASHQVPWKMAVDDARAVRKNMGNRKDPIDDRVLFGLLGLTQNDVERSSPVARRKAGVAIPGAGEKFKFLFRKTYPESKRFELSRFIGDYLQFGLGREGWLANTDLGTARQKYQRAFAAEFLCPIEGLREFLQEDFTEPALEEAAKNFNVSGETVTSMLANNGLIQRPFKYADPRFPY